MRPVCLGDAAALWVAGEEVEPVDAGLFEEAVGQQRRRVFADVVRVGAMADPDVRRRNHDCPPRDPHQVREELDILGDMFEDIEGTDDPGGVIGDRGERTGEVNGESGGHVMQRDAVSRGGDSGPAVTETGPDIEPVAASQFRGEGPLPSALEIFAAEITREFREVAKGRFHGRQVRTDEVGRFGQETNFEAGIGGEKRRREIEVAPIAQSETTQKDPRGMDEVARADLSLDEPRFRPDPVAKSIDHAGNEEDGRMSGRGSGVGCGTQAGERTRGEDVVVVEVHDPVASAVGEVAVAGGVPPVAMGAIGEFDEPPGEGHRLPEGASFGGSGTVVKQQNMVARGIEFALQAGEHRGEAGAACRDGEDREGRIRHGSGCTG